MYYFSQFPVAELKFFLQFRFLDTALKNEFSDLMDLRLLVWQL